MISSGRILALFAAGVLSLPASVLADNILVFGNYPSKNTLATSLTSLGHTVDNQTGLPADLSGYDSIWHVDAGTPLTPAYQTQLADYLAAGGGVHLTGERPCCEALNDSLQALVNAVVSGGGIQVGDLGDINGPYSINPAATSGLATTPNSVSVWVPSASGGMGGLGNLPDPNILATGAGEVPVGGAWTESDLVSGSGRLTLMMDTNWFSNPGGGDNIAIIENIQHFLTSSGGVQPPVTGTARFLVTKHFEDGLSADVEVTLTCSTGLPLQQSFMIGGGDFSGVTFVLTNIPAGGADCTVTESGSPDGYTPVMNGGDGCVFENVDTGTRSCEIINTADDATYTVNMDWPPAEGGFPVDESALVSIVCDGEITSSGAYQEGDDWVLEGTLSDGDQLVADINTSAGAVGCSVELGTLASGVESSSDCELISLAAGDTYECTITNSSFFEGIPTLGRYGLVVLTLLMLGIGFVGMRRFT